MVCYNRFMRKTWILVTLVLLITLFVFYRKTHAPTNSVIKDIPEYSQKEDSEAEIVTNYIKENIKTIATNSPVLGGSWYVVSVTVDPAQDSGSVVYEDGHIQSSAFFKYKYTKDLVKIDSFIVQN